MKTAMNGTLASLALAAALAGGADGAVAATPSNLVSETLRQQSAAERSSCAGVRRTIQAGADASLVVRTGVELGYNSCQVIRCALETGPAAPAPGARALCEQVIRGAVSAGVQPDVISRCSADACDPAAVAAILAATLLEPNYCYFSPREVEPDPAAPPQPVIDRDYPRPQASPFRF
jgi:hypothetical protein